MVPGAGLESALTFNQQPKPTPFPRPTSNVKAHMEIELNNLFYIGPAVFLLGLTTAIISLVLVLSGRRKPQALHLMLVTVWLGIAGFLVGAWLGIDHFCAPKDAGNLCGLGGVFATGPLASGLCMILGAIFAIRARRNAPQQ